MMHEPPISRCAVCDEWCMGKVCRTCKRKGMKLALMTQSQIIIDKAHSAC